MKNNTAGLRLDVDFLEKLDAASIVAELKRIAEVLGKTNVSAKELDTYGRVHYHTVVKRFGSLRHAMEAAGLKSSRYTKATDAELLKQLTDLWAITLRDSGRRPRTAELAKYGFPVGSALIIKRFGSWKKALIAASQAASGEVPAYPPRTPAQRLPVPVRKRYLVIKRDLYTCSLCNRTGVALEVDHIIPVCRGGSDRLENLQTLCQDCNRGKGGSLP